MAKYEAVFKEGDKPVRVKSLKQARYLAVSKVFYARKLLRKKRKGPWAKYAITGHWVRSVARK